MKSYNVLVKVFPVGMKRHVRDIVTRSGET